MLVQEFQKCGIFVSYLYKYVTNINQELGSCLNISVKYVHVNVLIYVFSYMSIYTFVHT